MHSKATFREIVKEKFHCDIKNFYLPDQTYINRLITSFNRAEPKCYGQCHPCFISEYRYLKSVGILQSIQAFIDGCLNQLLWINTILESGMYASTEEELEEMFDYVTPIMLGNPWILDKVTKKGVFFRGDESFQDSRVIINSDNIIDITIALSRVEQHYNELLAAKKSKPDKSVVMSSSIAKESSLFKSIELQNECLNVLKEITHPILDPRGHFLGSQGMIAAITLWYEKCKVLGFISNDTKNTNEAVAKEIMKIIPDLIFVPNNFSQHTVANKYKAEIEQKLELLSPK